MLPSSCHPVYSVLTEYALEGCRPHVLSQRPVFRAYMLVGVERMDFAKGRYLMLKYSIARRFLLCADAATQQDSGSTGIELPNLISAPILPQPVYF